MNLNYGTILVVDDNPAILTAVRITLRNVFEHVITLSAPDAILATMQKECVDVILLDMNFSLGVNSGREGMIWLSAIHRKHPHVPVVLVTAYADVQLAVRGLKNGASDFVTKPWDNDDLIRVLKDAVDRTRQVASLDEVEKATDRFWTGIMECFSNSSVKPIMAFMGVRISWDISNRKAVRRYIRNISNESSCGCPCHPCVCDCPNHLQTPMSA